MPLLEPRLSFEDDHDEVVHEAGLASDLVDRVEMSGSLLTEDIREKLASAGLDVDDAASLRLASDVLKDRADQLQRVGRHLSRPSRKSVPGTVEAIARELQRIQAGREGDPMSERNKSRRRVLRDRLKALEGKK